jgi:ankyrin repeat protein
MENGPTHPGHAEFVEAVRRFDLEAAKRMLWSGADPNAAGDDSPSAMGTIGDWGCYDPERAVPMLKLLISHGGNINQIDPGGYTPLMYALDTLAIDGLQEDGRNPADLDWSFVETLLEDGADPGVVAEGHDGRQFTGFDVARSWGATYHVEFARRVGATSA